MDRENCLLLIPGLSQFFVNAEEVTAEVMAETMAGTAHAPTNAASTVTCSPTRAWNELFSEVETVKQLESTSTTTTRFLLKCLETVALIPSMNTPPNRLERTSSATLSFADTRDLLPYRSTLFRLEQLVEI